MILSQALAAVSNLYELDSIKLTRQDATGFYRVTGSVSKHPPATPLAAPVMGTYNSNQKNLSFLLPVGATLQQRINFSTDSQNDIDFAFYGDKDLLSICFDYSLRLTSPFPPQIEAGRINIKNTTYPPPNGAIGGSVPGLPVPLAIMDNTQATNFLQINSVELINNELGVYKINIQLNNTNLIKYNIHDYNIVFDFYRQRTVLALFVLQDVAAPITIAFNNRLVMPTVADDEINTIKMVGMPIIIVELTPAQAALNYYNIDWSQIRRKSGIIHF